MSDRQTARMIKRRQQHARRRQARQIFKPEIVALETDHFDPLSEDRLIMLESHEEPQLYDDFDTLDFDEMLGYAPLNFYSPTAVL